MKTKSLLFLLLVGPLSLTFSDRSFNYTYTTFEVMSARTESHNIFNINADKKIKNVIIMIGDGMGYNQVEVGGIYKGETLTFADKANSNWTYHALVNTDSLTSEAFTLDESKSLIRPDENASLYDTTPSPYGNNPASDSITPYTDSAAGGTAIATGRKVTNSRIALDNTGRKIENLVEIAHSMGKKTGVLTSDELTGATPASFLAHVSNRYQADNIIKDTAISGADLVMAQNPSQWKDNKSTYETLYKNNGYDNICYNVSNLDSSKKKTICLPDSISPINDEVNPTLTDLTMFALDYLDNSEEGFFLMVEGAKIDKACHANNIYYMLKELLGFEEAVKIVENWAAGRDDTIVLVTADHECGGLYYSYDSATQANILNDVKFKSQNHSRARVRLDVLGDISEFTEAYSSYFKMLNDYPYWDNTYTFNLACSYL